MLTAFPRVVTQDQKAQQFLATIDKDPSVGKMVDCTS